MRGGVPHARDDAAGPRPGGMRRRCWPAPGRPLSSPPGVVALTAVVFALVAGHGTLARVQRLDDALAAWADDLRPGAAADGGRQGLQRPRAGVRHAAVGVRRGRVPCPAPPVVAPGRLPRGRAESEVLIGSLKGIYDRARPPGSLVATSGASCPRWATSVAASVTVVAAVIALVPAGRRRALWGAAAVASLGL